MKIYFGFNIDYDGIVFSNLFPLKMFFKQLGRRSELFLPLLT